MRGFVGSSVLVGILGSMFFAVAAGADSLSCADAASKLKYETYVQVGGPCCGRSTLKLTDEGKVLKETLRINGGGSLPGSFTDSDPALSIGEGDRTDLGHSSTDPAKNLRINYVAMDLTIQRSDGKPALPGTSSAIVVVGVICEVDSNLYPVP